MDFLIKYALDLIIIAILVFVVIKSIFRNVFFTIINVSVIAILLGAFYFALFDQAVHFVQYDLLTFANENILNGGLNGLMQPISIGDEDLYFTSINSIFVSFGELLKYIESYSGSGATLYTSDYMSGMALTLSRAVILIVILVGVLVVAYILTWVIYLIFKIFMKKTIKKNKLRILSIIINLIVTSVFICVFVYLCNTIYNGATGILAMENVQDLDPNTFPEDYRETIQELADAISMVKQYVAILKTYIDMIPTFQWFTFLNTIDFHFLDFTLDGTNFISLSTGINSYFNSLVESVNNLVDKASTFGGAIS